MRISGLRTGVVGTPWRHLIGRDPFEIESLCQQLVRLDYGRSGEIAMSALAVIEMACWDIVGKALGMPVYRLLGGKVRDRIEAYANGWYTVERTPEAFHEAARRAVARGCGALKFDPLGAGLWKLATAERTRSLEPVEAVRGAVGDDVELLIHSRHELRELFELQAADVVQPDIAPFGGILETRKLAVTAESHHVMLARRAERL
jgi:galactonate dehydratase